MVEVRYNLAEVLEERKMSVGELARRAGVSKSYVSYIARNRIHPSLYMLAQIAEALAVPVEELYTVLYHERS